MARKQGVHLRKRTALAQRLLERRERCSVTGSLLQVVAQRSEASTPRLHLSHHARHVESQRKPAPHARRELKLLPAQHQKFLEPTELFDLFRQSGQQVRVLRRMVQRTLVKRSSEHWVAQVLRSEPRRTLREEPRMVGFHGQLRGFAQHHQFGLLVPRGSKQVRET